MTSPPEHRSDGAVLTAVSNAVVQIVREYTGRGPTKARTTIDRDLIVVVVQNALTPGERYSPTRAGRETRRSRRGRAPSRSCPCVTGASTCWPSIRAIAGSS